MSAEEAAERDEEADGPAEQPAEEPDTEPEGEPEATDEQPDVDDGAADLDGLDVDTSEMDPNAEEEADDTDAEPADDGGASVDPSRGEWGDMYVALCTQSTNAILEKHGDGHTIDEDHFRSIDLDDHFNAVLEKYASDSQMEPEQALVVGTAVAVGGPIALHTDLLADLAGEFEL